MTMVTTHSGSFDVIVWLLVTTVIHGVRHGVHAATEDSSPLQPSYANDDDFQASSFLLHVSPVASPSSEDTRATKTLSDDRGITASKAFQTDSTNTAVTSTNSTDVSPQARKMYTWMEENILRKLLNQGQIQQLATRGYGGTGESSIQDGTDTSIVRTLQSVHIVGVSPSFVAALRHLYQVKVSRLLDVKTLDPFRGRRKKRQAEVDDVQVEVMNVEREGNSSVVTLDFFLEQDGELVAMETALQNLQSLTMEEMTALLEAPVISPPVKVDRVDIAASSVTVTSLDTATPSYSTSESTKGRFARSAESSVGGDETNIFPFFSTVNQIIPTRVYLTSLPVSLEGISGTVLFPALSVSTTVLRSSSMPDSNTSPGPILQSSQPKMTPPLDTTLRSERTETPVTVLSLQPSEMSSMFTTGGTQSLKQSVEVSGSMQTVSAMLESSRSVFGELSDWVSAAHYQPLEASSLAVAESDVFLHHAASSVEVLGSQAVDSKVLDLLTMSLTFSSLSVSPESSSRMDSAPVTVSAFGVNTIHTTVESYIHSAAPSSGSITSTASLPSHEQQMSSIVFASSGVSSGLLSEQLLPSSGFSSHSQMPFSSSSVHSSQSHLADLELRGSLSGMSSFVVTASSPLTKSVDQSQPASAWLSVSPSLETSESVTKPVSEFFSDSASVSARLGLSASSTVAGSVSPTSLGTPTSFSLSSTQLSRSLRSQVETLEPSQSVFGISRTVDASLPFSSEVNPTPSVPEHTLDRSLLSAQQESVVTFSMGSSLPSATGSIDRLQFDLSSRLLSRPEEDSFAMLRSLESSLESSSKGLFTLSHLTSLKSLPTTAIPSLSITATPSVSSGPIRDSSTLLMDQSTSMPVQSASSVIVTAAFDSSSSYPHSSSPSVPSSESPWSSGFIPSASSFPAVGVSSSVVSLAHMEQFYESASQAASFTESFHPTASASDVQTQPFATSVLSRPPLSELSSTGVASVGFSDVSAFLMSSSPGVSGGVNSLSTPMFAESDVVSGSMPTPMIHSDSISFSSVVGSSLHTFVGSQSSEMFPTPYTLVSSPTLTSSQMSFLLSSEASLSVSFSPDSSLSVAKSLESSLGSEPSLSAASFSLSVSPSVSTTLEPSLVSEASASFSPSFSLATSPSLSRTLESSLGSGASFSASFSLAASPSVSTSLEPSLASHASFSPSFSLATSPSLSRTLESSLGSGASFSASFSLAASPSVSTSLEPSLASHASFSPSFSLATSPSLSRTLESSLGSGASFSASFSLAASPSVSTTPEPSLASHASFSASVSFAASPSVSTTLEPSLASESSFSASFSFAASPSLSTTLEPSWTPSVGTLEPSSPPSTSMAFSSSNDFVSASFQTSTPPLDISQSLGVSSAETTAKASSATSPIPRTIIETVVASGLPVPGATPSLTPSLPDTPILESSAFASPPLSPVVRSSAAQIVASVGVVLKSPTILPTPTSSFTVSASRAPVVTKPPTRLTSFLRMKIQVQPDVNVKSATFLQMIKAALRRLYLAALAAARARPANIVVRRKREVSGQVEAQVLNVDRSSEKVDEVSLDFTVANNGQEVPADNALATLKNLTSVQMADIITYPVLDLTKEVAVNNTLVIANPTDSDMVIVTSGIFVVAVRRSAIVTSSSVSVAPTSDLVVFPTVTSSSTVTSMLLSPSASLDSGVSSALSTSIPQSLPSSAIPPSSFEASPTASGILPSGSEILSRSFEVLSSLSGSFSVSLGTTPGGVSTTLMPSSDVQFTSTPVSAHSPFTTPSSMPVPLVSLSSVIQSQGPSGTLMTSPFSLSTSSEHPLTSPFPATASAAALLTSPFPATASPADLLTSPFPATESPAALLTSPFPASAPPAALLTSPFPATASPAALLTSRFSVSAASEILFTSPFSVLSPSETLLSSPFSVQISPSSEPFPSLSGSGEIFTSPIVMSSLSTIVPSESAFQTASGTPSVSLPYSSESSLVESLSGATISLPESPFSSVVQSEIISSSVVSSVTVSLTSSKSESVEFTMSPTLSLSETVSTVAVTLTQSGTPMSTPATDFRTTIETSSMFSPSLSPSTELVSSESPYSGLTVTESVSPEQSPTSATPLSSSATPLLSSAPSVFTTQSLPTSSPVITPSAATASPLSTIPSIPTLLSSPPVLTSTPVASASTPLLSFSPAITSAHSLSSTPKTTSTPFLFSTLASTPSLSSFPATASIPLSSITVTASTPTLSSTLASIPSLSSFPATASIPLSSIPMTASIPTLSSILASTPSLSSFPATASTPISSIPVTASTPTLYSTLAGTPSLSSFPATASIPLSSIPVTASTHTLSSILASIPSLSSFSGTASIPLSSIPVTASTPTLSSTLASTPSLSSFSVTASTPISSIPVTVSTSTQSSILASIPSLSPFSGTASILLSSIPVTASTPTLSSTLAGTPSLSSFPVTVSTPISSIPVTVSTPTLSSTLASIPSFSSFSGTASILLSSIPVTVSIPTLSSTIASTPSLSSFPVTASTPVSSILVTTSTPALSSTLASIPSFSSFSGTASILLSSIPVTVSTPTLSSTIASTPSLSSFPVTASTPISSIPVTTSTPALSSTLASIPSVSSFAGTASIPLSSIPVTVSTPTLSSTIASTPSLSSILATTSSPLSSTLGVISTTPLSFTPVSASTPLSSTTATVSAPFLSSTPIITPSLSSILVTASTATLSSTLTSTPTLSATPMTTGTHTLSSIPASAPSLSSFPATASTSLSSITATVSAPFLSSTTDITPSLSSTPVTASTPTLFSTPVTASTPSLFSTPVTASTPSLSSTPVTASSPTLSSTPVTASTPSLSSTPVTASTPSLFSTPVTTSTPSLFSTPVTASSPTLSTTPVTASTPTLSAIPVSTPFLSSTPATASTPLSSTPATASTPVLSSTSASTPPLSSTPVTTGTPFLSSTPDSTPPLSSPLETASTPMSSTTATISTPPQSSTPSTTTTESLPTSSPVVTSTSTSSSTTSEPKPTVSSTPPTISPSPTTTQMIPSSSVTPTPDTLRDALMRVDLELKPEQDEQSAQFKNNIETGLAMAYREALQFRRKRHAPIYDVMVYAPRHHSRHLRQAGPEIEAEMTNVVRNSSDHRITNVTFYVMEDGSPVPARKASLTFNKLTANALSAVLAYPVVSEVRPLHDQLVPPEPFDEDTSLLFVVAIVMPCVLVLLLALVLMGFLLRNCRDPPLAHDSADVVPTKYQRGESLDDYNLHVDVERGEIVDRTPGHTPDPASKLPHSQSHGKTPLTAFQPRHDDTLDSKRLMIDKWLQGDPKRLRGSSIDSLDSVAKSDTFLYARQQKEKKKSKHLEVPRESYKTEYLHALNLPETALNGEDDSHAGDGTGERRESFALEERSFDEDMKRPLSPAERRPPQAKPRSFVGKLRESMRRRKRSVTPEYNTQSTVVSALGDSAHNLTDRSMSRDTSVEREPQRSRDENKDAQHTDASSEFTMIMSPCKSPRSSRERLGSTGSSSVGAEPHDHAEQSRHRHRDYDPRLASSDTRDPGKNSRRIQTLQTSLATDSDDVTVVAFDTRSGRTERLGAQQELSYEGYYPSLCTTQTQTSLTSSSDDSRGGDVRVRSVAVGPCGVNRKTQTPGHRERERPKAARRKPVKAEAVQVKVPSHPLLSSSSSSYLLGSGSSMGDDKLEDELPQERIKPFVKMSQIQLNPPEKETGVPVKFRRNIFEEGPMVPGAPDGATTGEAGQMFHKPACHMRAQHRLSYSALDPEERRQTEILDTAAARQQLLLRQQQEVMEYAHRQQVEQKAQHIVNRSLATGTTSTTPADRQPQADRQKLNTLLNEACVLAPHSFPVQPQAFKLHAGIAWTPPQPALTNLLCYNPMTVLTNHAAPVTAGPPPGAPGGYTVMGKDELIQAVRKELKRLQQDEIDELYKK